jgi:hypothetical protein
MGSMVGAATMLLPATIQMSAFFKDTCDHLGFAREFKLAVATRQPFCLPPQTQISEM